MWQAKRKVAVATGEGSASEMKLDIKSASSSRRNKNREASKNNRQQLRKFFNSVGSSIESLIDATPLGVPTPVEPWNPTTDKKKAMLSNPISVLNAVSDTIDALSPARLLGKVEGSAWMLASSKMLLGLREGLAAAVKAEESLDMRGCTVDVPVLVEPDPIDATISSEAGCEAFVDLGADQWGNSSRCSNPIREAMVEAKAIRKRTMSKMLALIDNLTLRANGIVVTSDDCSVECSLSSLIDDSEFEACSPYSAAVTVSDDEEEEIESKDCPSVVTEIVMEDLEGDIKEDDGEEDTEEIDTPKDDDQEVQEEGTVQEFKKDLNCTQDITSDEEEDFVMAEEPDSDEEDFVDVREEFDIDFFP